MKENKRKERILIYRGVCDLLQVEKIEELWLKFKPYADKGFEQLFRGDLVSRFWEMYLGALLIQEKKELRKKNDYGPNICVIENDGGKIWLEASAPDKGEGNDKVEKKKVCWIPEENIILRILSTIKDKYEDKYFNCLYKGGLIKES